MKPFARVFVFSGLVFLPASIAVAQVKAGPEFRVNTYTTQAQLASDIAADPAGNFVVTWNSDPQDGSSWGVFAQRHAADGQRLGAEFRVNTYTTGLQVGPRVAVAERAYVVVWPNLPGVGSLEEIEGQRYSSDGSPLGGEFAVSEPGTTRGPVVVSGRDGSFMVAWANGGVSSDVHGRFYLPNGQPVANAFPVNTYVIGDQASTAIASNGRGVFVVTWTSDVQEGPLSASGVFGQRFEGGAPTGSEFHVNTYTTGPQGSSAVAMSASGEFVVAFVSLDASSIGIFARRYDRAGAPVGAEFQVNSYVTGIQQLPRIATDAAGNFVVAWSGEGDGSGNGTFGQRFNASGFPRGTQFTINSATAGDQGPVAVASDAVGNFVVTWASDGTGSDDVFGQRFGGLTPAALAVDPPDGGGNGVLEPAETATVRPSWRNVNGLPQAFGGAALAFTGPLGPAYVLSDATADYGTVTDGSTASCQATGNCFAVSITGSRPSTHWDATLPEVIQPDAQGQVKIWTLHVGDSFTDVPRSGAFYRFVETVLHKAVTGGCGPTTYCPLASTTREQMAVFALVSKEGAGYAPPACGTPMFGDVPASSPFCRWIEELARRGVVGGCGGGNYCPSAAVTREQMAIFALKTLEGPAYTPPACGAPMYSDVPATSPFCPYIEELTRRGVVSGCGGGNYCPSAAVSREQMSVFLTVTFSLLLYGV